MTGGGREGKGGTSGSVRRILCCRLEPEDGGRWPGGGPRLPRPGLPGGVRMSRIWGCWEWEEPGSPVGPILVGKQRQ